MIIARHIEPEAKLRSAQTACPYCGVGCGVDIDFRGAEPVAISGSPEHPSNHGRLCVKGQHLLHTLGNDGRLLYPQVAGQRVSWQCALDKVAQGFSDIIARHGPDAVAFYVSGQILTEDYYVANKIMKGYIGSANIDTNSRLCMSSAVSAYKRAFGEDVVPCDYRDLEQTELLVLIGSNAAWTHPVLYQRMERAKRMNPALKVVLVDPRRTPTAELADLHLQISPGSDAGLYNGLLNYLQAEGGLDQAFIDRATEGSEQALAAAANWGLARSAEFCGLSEAQLLTFYQWFNAAERAISFYSMGINQSSSGVDKCQAIINAHLASGKILTPGSGPFSITGQPNAMGGREVGGMANQLAAHMDIDKPDQRQTLQDFWRSPTMASRPGKMAMDLFDDVSAGKIKALWIIGTNPMVSLSNRNAVAAALTRCELVVVSDCVAENDTLAYADIKLPATGWLEKDGTVTNSERRIYRQRGLVAAPGEAKHDWQILAEFARTMGYSGFDYQHPSDVFREWAQLTAHANNGQRQLDLGAISELDQRAYDQLAPQQWPLPKD
ncbi:MAG: molybdopterin-dependent oxidoreductase, partial [Cellvibrionaceae bacterium]|nr:molybdopterin-dependent oxidoreductase [Cellvibrionaceae bacterium]